jgi:uncharacterized protein YoxC
MRVRFRAAALTRASDACIRVLRSQEALRLERDRREKAELDLQDLSNRHTAVLSKLDVLQRSVEILRYEKELQKDVEDKARQLDRLQSAVRLLTRTMLDDLRTCPADVRAQHEMVRLFAESSSAEANQRKMLQQDLQKVGCPSRLAQYFSCILRLAARCCLSPPVMRVPKWLLVAD